MKKVIILSVLSFVVFSTTFATEPVSGETPCCPVVFESPNVELAYNVEQLAHHFEPAYYNEQTNSLHFESYGKILTVNVYDNKGELSYALPVNSSKLRLSKNMFASGDYKLAFVIEGSEDAMLAYLKIN